MFSRRYFKHQAWVSTTLAGRRCPPAAAGPTARISPPCGQPPSLACPYMGMCRKESADPYTRSPPPLVARDSHYIYLGFSPRPGGGGGEQVGESANCCCYMPYKEVAFKRLNRLSPWPGCKFRNKIKKDSIDIWCCATLMTERNCPAIRN